MFNPIAFFKPLPPKPVIVSGAEIDRRFRRFRFQEVATMTVAYAIFYVCRLAFSATKKDMIEQGLYTTDELGYVGSAMLIAYGIGKCFNGFLADRANIRRFMAFGLFVSALANFLVGFHLPAVCLAALWFANGIAQSTGAPSAVVGLSRWFAKRERGTFYGIWSCSNNLGEALAYILTAVIMVWTGRFFGANWAWRSGFWGASAMGLAGIALILAFYRDSPQSEGLPSVAEWKREPVDADEVKTAGDVNLGQRIALRSWAVWMIALSGLFFAMSRYAIIDWGIYFLQVKKGYATGLAATIVSINSIVGGVSSAASGWVSDRFFKGNRNLLAFVFGLMNVTALCLFMLVPGQHLWLDVMAMVLFGTAMGVLLCFLGGLMAVDLVPRVAAGAAMGIVGIVTYAGASLQSVVSGYLIRSGGSGKMSAQFLNMAFDAFGRHFTVDYIALYWIGMALLSVLCALSVWRVKGE